jgi:hypothetical protein
LQYVIYSQVVAARDALQLGCSASVVGNLDEAEAYSKSETDMQQSQAADGKQAEVDLYKVSCCGGLIREVVVQMPMLFRCCSGATLRR